MRKAAVICANGIGDALLMMIAASNLRHKGFEVTIFHNHPLLISPMFESYSFLPFPPILHWESALTAYDIVIVQNDHSERSWALLNLREKKELSKLVFFFPTHCKKKQEQDFLFDSKLSIATNIAQSCKKILKLKKNL